VRWAIVGSVTTLLDYFLFLFFFSIFKTILISNLFAGIISITSNYIFHYFWSFRSNFQHSSSGIRYVINLVVIWSIGTFMLSYLVNTGIKPELAKIIPISFTAPIGFISLKFFVFKK
jgi:putative flippase GtrA